MRGGASYWVASAESPGYDRLEGDLTVDVAVVGGGIAGLTAAVLLAHAGVRVAVLEGAEIGSGVTGHTTGKLTAGHGLAYSRLENEHGPDAAQAYASSQTAGVELVFRLARRLRIECDLERVPNFVYTERAEELERLEEEVAAARRAGLSADLVRDLETPFPAVGAVRLDGQGQLHARKYALGLARSVSSAGCRVFEHSRVLEVEPEPDRVRLETEEGVVTASEAILATHAPITSKGLFFARAHPRRAYAVAAPVRDVRLEGMWINVGSPTRSVRTAPAEGGARLVIAVGEGHRVGQEPTPPRYDVLAEFFERHFGVPPVYRWSTQDLASVDGLPYVGRLGGDAARLLVATGFGGWGLSNGSLAGSLLASSVLGRDTPWSWLYDPSRSSLRRSPATLLRENANVARQLVEGRLRSRSSSLADLPPGSGDILDLDGERAAVYRDEEGELVAVSAICTHMGCVVAWNVAERTWDCPCHGSRFDVEGAVLEGPATRPLAPVDVLTPSAPR